MADRPGVEGTYQTLQLDGRTTPVEACFILVQLVCVVGQAVVLHLTREGASRQCVDGLNHGLRAQHGKAVMQAAAGVGGGNRRSHLEQHRAGIQSGFHLHYGDAAFTVTRLHGALDRRRAAPARQQRGMAVDAAQTRGVQHHLRQDQSIGHHNHQVRLQRGQFGLCFRRPQGGGLVHRNAVLDGQLLDRAGHQLVAAAGRAVRLGVDGDDLMLGAEQGLEVFGGELRGASKDDTHE